MNETKNLERKLQMLMKDTENPQLYHDIGLCLFALKDGKNAQRYLQKACMLAPADVDILYDYALILCSGYEWRKAAEVLEKCVERDPQDKDVLEKTADTYYQLGEFSHAARYYEMAKGR